MEDMVNHPKHYTSDPSGVECIEIVRHRNYNVGNAIKYLWRAGLKNEDKVFEDLRKAIFYIEDEIKRLEMVHNQKQGINSRDNGQSAVMDPRGFIISPATMNHSTTADLDMWDKFGIYPVEREED